MQKLFLLPPSWSYPVIIMIPLLCIHGTCRSFSLRTNSNPSWVMHAGLQMCPDQPAAKMPGRCLCMAALRCCDLQHKTVIWEMGQGRGRGCCRGTGLLLYLQGSNVTLATGPRNCCKVSLPHWAAPSHSFPPQFHGLLLSTRPHHSLDLQNDAAGKYL